VRPTVEHSPPNLRHLSNEDRPPIAHRELLEAHPVVPIAEGHALSIGIFSHGDRLSFGLYADPEASRRAQVGS
jgi:hypothetical protein